MKIKRSQAARLLDDIREMLAARQDAEHIEAMLERQYDIPPLKACTGEAHSNAYIDNCGVCAPRWGWLGEEVEVS